jgi:hypothetical protein
METETEDYQEQAILDAVWERCAAPGLRDVLKREHNERLTRRSHDVALEKWGSEIEMEIMADLENSSKWKT